jgi:transcriptional regulator with XRE-family HTH domain
MSQDTSIPAAIRAIRKRREISQAALGQILYVSPNTISRWERGAILPSNGNLIALFRLAQSEREVGPLVQALTAQHILISDLHELGLQTTSIITEAAAVGQSLNADSMGQ